MKLKVLIACEESQEVCRAFRELGHEAYSCDIIECSGGHPEWHIQCNVLDVIGNGDKRINLSNGDYVDVQEWDLIIAHPPCTYLSRAGCRWLFPKGKLNEERHKKGLQAKEFFMKFYNLDCDYIAIENPHPHKIFNMPKESQIIQPWQFGHKVTKRTFLWLKGLPELKTTDIVEPEYYIDKKGIKHSSLTGWSQKKKSKTFPGIAKAMAEQWSEFILNSYNKEAEQ